VYSDSRRKGLARTALTPCVASASLSASRPHAVTSRIGRSDLRARADVLLHPLAGVLETQSRVLAVDVTEDVDPSSVRQGVDGVQDQVHRHLAKIRGDADHTDAGGDRGLELDAGAQSVRLGLPAGTGEVEGVLHQLTQIGPAGRLVLGMGPREALYPPEDTGSVVGRLLDEPELEASVDPGNLRTEGDHREQIVELVNQAEAHLAELPESLRVDQVFLEALRIPAVTHQRHIALGGRGQRLDAQLEGQCALSSRCDATNARGFRAGALGRIGKGPSRCGGDEIGQHRAADLFTVAHDLPEASARAEHVPFRVDEGDTGAGERLEEIDQIGGQRRPRIGGPEQELPPLREQILQ
jgi:hypothetical protein